MPYILPFLTNNQSEKYFQMLTGNRGIENSLEKLNETTQEEARMADHNETFLFFHFDVLVDFFRFWDLTTCHRGTHASYDVGELDVWLQQRSYA